MTAVSITTVGASERRAWVEARLAHEFEPWRRRLISRARYRYRLAVEDCEELAADTLWTWYQQLETDHGVREDTAYLFAVLHNRALDRKKAQGRLKRTADTLPLELVDEVGSDLYLDALVGEREELADLAELARDLLSDRELGIVLLSRQGVPRAQIAERYGLSVRRVERCLERAQHKLDEGVAAMRSRGRCAMVALAISDINAGRVTPGDPGFERGMIHLRRCPRCRAITPTDRAV